MKEVVAIFLKNKNAIIAPKNSEIPDINVYVIDFNLLPVE